MEHTLTGGSILLEHEHLKSQKNTFKDKGTSIKLIQIVRRLK